MFLLSIQIFRSNLNENGSDPAQRVSVLDLFPERFFTIQDACVILTEALVEIFSSNVTAARHAAHELNVLYYILKIISGRKISLKNQNKQTNTQTKKTNKNKNPPNIKSTAVSPKEAGVHKLKISSLDTTLIC